ncbi:MAG: metalloregulator ArsR/SmtB family transcription factor [Nitrospiraceae bacterium]|nr:metalloregulator ArsR/SmtB family transcription factor [Nitrospiraceae bacterium]MDA8325560.1 metalloregulator ArsR/SmtB family transcription factor [Nitrospiraceae bacterium]
MQKESKTIFEIQAEICKTIASSKRLEIINALKSGEKSVTELVDILGVPKANVSQHLAMMRHKGILKTRRDGVNIYYSIAHPKVIEACNMMREVMVDMMRERKKIARLIEY